MINHILDLIFPRRCLFCGKFIEAGYSCDECATELFPITGKICRRCGAEEDKCVCGAIVNNYDAAAAALYYKGAGKRLVLRCKNVEHKHSVRLAAGFLKTAFQRYYEKRKIDIITSVPRDYFSYLLKGENHADVMAKALAKSVRLPYSHLLIKVKSGKMQKRLTRFERLENISGAYKANSKNKIRGKNILLIDDVKTTGATLNECAKILKREYAAKVYCLTLAVTCRDLADKCN